MARHNATPRGGRIVVRCTSPSGVHRWRVVQVRPAAVVGPFVVADGTPNGYGWDHRCRRCQRLYSKCVAGADPSPVVVRV